MSARGSARQAAVRWAIDIVGRDDVVYLDTETTGLGPDAEIVDIAVVDQAGRVLLNSLVQPRNPIPAEATRVHGITNKMVMNAPEWPEVYQELARIIQDYPTLIIYNAAYDRRLISQTCRRYGISVPRADWQCAMLNYAAYRGEWNARYGNYRWHTLEKAAIETGAPMPPTHRALDDAQACRHVVLSMAGVATARRAPTVRVPARPAASPAVAPATSGVRSAQPSRASAAAAEPVVTIRELQSDSTEAESAEVERIEVKPTDVSDTPAAAPPRQREWYQHWWLWLIIVLLPIPWIDWIAIPLLIYYLPFTAKTRAIIGATTGVIVLFGFIAMALGI
ncbi:exonuclease domain-containing protein [Sphaerobacter thermophilus]|uniref:3'-5' exonuclease n=1 Tax=Sphaerobacter thermophilus TaxID=2057 RepID=UPI0039C4171B